MKNLFLILICLIGLNIFAQQTHVEIAPNSNVNPDAISRDTFNLEFSFPCTAFISEYGVETNGSDIYVTQWVGNLIAKYDQSGTVLDTFSIPGVEKVRDLAYDGQYYYGSPHAYSYYVLDMENKVRIDLIATPFQVRGMAYDPVEDVLWATRSWSPEFYKMDMQGNVLDTWIPTGITMDAISGLAYDNITSDGPFLWGFSQDSTGVMIVKYDIATQSQTGSMIDMSGLCSGIAGGLFIENMAPARTGENLGGMIQNQLVFAFDLGYANQLVNLEKNDMLKTFELYPNPVKDVLNIKLAVVDNAKLKYKVLNQAGQVIHDQIIDVNASAEISINTSLFESGIYFVQIGNEKGYLFTKKFIVTK